MPPARDPEVLNRLKQVYGAIPPQLTPEYKKTDRYTKQLKVRGKNVRRPKKNAQVVTSSYFCSVYLFDMLGKAAGRASWLV